jgi:hypothetical protein
VRLTLFAKCKQIPSFLGYVYVKEENARDFLWLQVKWGKRAECKFFE